MADLYDVLNPDAPPDEKTKADAAIAALRGRQRAGLIGIMSGVPALQDAGRAMETGASGENKLIAQYGPDQRALKMALAQYGLLGRQAGANARVESAQIGAGAREYGSDRSLEGVKYRSDNSLAGVKYTSDTGAQSRINVAQIAGGDRQTASDAIKFQKSMDVYQDPGLKPLRDTVDRARAVRALVENPDGTMQDLTKMQMTDLSLGLTRILTGSSRFTQQMINDLVPNTMRGDWAKISEWITNNPQVLHQQEFAGIMHAAVVREETIAKQRMSDVVKTRISAHTPFISSHPGLAGRILTDNGLDPNDYEDLLSGQAGGGAGGPVQPSGARPNIGGPAPVPAPTAAPGSAVPVPAGAPAVRRRRFNPATGLLE